MAQFEFTLTAKTPILFHADDVMASDLLDGWRKDPRNKGLSVPGDDRSPPWTWQVYLYHDGKNLAIPQENLMACLLKAGTQIPKPKGKGTFKGESQSGIVLGDEFLKFTNEGKAVPIGAIVGIKDQTFIEQFAAAKKLGFELKVKRARVGAAKHVRVRAMFRHWGLTGRLDVIEPTITKDVLAQMFEISGLRVGLGDWRPGAPQKPGPYGMFEASVKAIK
jgi:hypothetical protein